MFNKSDRELLQAVSHQLTGLYSKIEVVEKNLAAGQEKILRRMNAVEASDLESAIAERRVLIEKLNEILAQLTPTTTSRPCGECEGTGQIVEVEQSPLVRALRAKR